MGMKILILGLLYLLMLGCALSVKKKAEVNSWQSLFTEPCETLYIIMEDKVAFKFSSQDENQVFLTLGKLEKQLRTSVRDYKIKDIVVVIHNHLKDCTFSPRDHKLHWRLKKYGFRGLFLLYSNVRNKIYNIEEKEKNEKNKTQPA